MTARAAVYRRVYRELVDGALTPAVSRYLESDSRIRNDPVRRLLYENNVAGLIVVWMVSFIEANFLTRTQLKALRRFQAPEGLPRRVRPLQLSCFIYARDCFAHDPDGGVFPNNQHTRKFLGALGSRSFPYAEFRGDSVWLLPNAISQLDKLIRCFLKR